MFDYTRNGHELTFSLSGPISDIGSQLGDALDYVLSEYALYWFDVTFYGTKRTNPTTYISITDPCIDALKNEPSSEMVLKWSVICGVLKRAAAAIKNTDCNSMTKIADSLLSEMCKDNDFDTFWNRIPYCKNEEEVLALYPVKLLSKRYVKQQEFEYEDGKKIKMWCVSKYPVKA